MKREALLSSDQLYRWTLTRDWSTPFTSHRCVCWIMLNPSTADHLKDDPTIRSCIKRSDHWGYDSLVVVNLIPFRSSKPSDAMAWAADHTLRSKEQLTNGEHIIREAMNSALVVAAWGAAPWVNTMMVDAFPALYCIGKTNSGAPKHPLARGNHRVPEDTPPQIWRTP